MAYCFLLCVGLVALLVGVNCTTRTQDSRLANQQDDASCVRKVDVQLISAALRNNADEMEAAVKSGANVDAIVENLGPALVIAAVTGNYGGVEMLLDNRANVGAADADGYTAILNAAVTNRPDIAKLLISKGADVNAAAYVKVKGNTSAKLTPLLIARTKGYQEMVQLLTAAGAKE